MQDPSDEMLMALADDQLQGAEAEALLSQISSDPALAARFAVFSETRMRLQQAFAADSSADRLIAAINAAPSGEAGPKTGAAESRVVAFPTRKRLAAGLAVAASLVLAVGLGGYFAAPPNSASTGSLAAAALSELPTGAEVTLPDGGTVRALASYDTKVGLCRLVETQSSDDRSERLLACREQRTGWQTYVSVAASADEAYVTASDTAAEVIDQVLDDLGAGVALDKAAEAEALARIHDRQVDE